MARVGLARLEYLMERMNRNIDLEGSDITVNSLTSDTGVTVTAGGLGVTAGGLVVTAGNVGVTAGNFEVTAGTTYLKGVGGVIKHQATPHITNAGTGTITAAAIKTGIITCAASGAHSKPTETGTQLCDGLALGVTGDSIDFSLINTSSTGGQDVTITDAAADVTIVGNPIVAARSDDDDAISSGVGRFRVRRTGTKVVVIYRIA